MTQKQIYRRNYCKDSVFTFGTATFNATTAGTIRRCRRDHLPLESQRIQHVNLGLCHELGTAASLEKQLVFRALRAHPAAQSWIRSVLGGDIAMAVLFQKQLEFIVFEHPRGFALALGPSETKRFQTTHLVHGHASALAFIHKLLFHALFVDPLFESSKKVRESGIVFSKGSQGV